MQGTLARHVGEQFDCIGTRDLDQPAHVVGIQHLKALPRSSEIAGLFKMAKLKGIGHGMLLCICTT